MQVRRLAWVLAMVTLVACATQGRAPPPARPTHGRRPPRAPVPPARDGLSGPPRAGGGGAPDPEAPPLDPRFALVDSAITTAIEAGKMPGCVVVLGRHDEVLLRRAYGSRSILPERVAMTEDTVFDLASLTKPLATATSIMILAQQGKIELRALASRYVPELARLTPFTVEQLLVHTSGLPAGTPLSDYGVPAIDGTAPPRTVMMQKLAEKLQGKLKTLPGEHFMYSDVGFIVLEEIVRRASGADLATFTREHIWEPLGMTETGFLPGPLLRGRAAPTEQRDGQWMQGDVHDPRAFALGGIAGHAGLFSTADDLSKYARAMLAKGAIAEHRVLEDKTFESFVARHATSSGGRALGWDKDSRFATNRSALHSASAFGHGGFTGTAMWIDPIKDLYLVFLSNRVHPDGKGAVNPLVAEIATLAIEASEVKPGIDVLRAESFERLRGSRVGLVTNASARAKDGTSTLDALRAAPGVTLSAIFSPEHGILAAREGKIGDGSYHGVPVYSLYGERSAPTSSTLDGIDTLVFDLQDAGVRFYTYASTMKQAMKVAQDRKLRFVVLDRPNPVGGTEVAGPMLDAPSSFVNHHALPVRHGMTMGELARLFADEDGLSVQLEVVRMQGWRRKDYFDRTGLTWVSPSPNLRTVDQVVLYPAVGLLESTNLSVGRGTDTPFEVIGAPFIDGEVLARMVEARGIPGLSAVETSFVPTTSVHQGKRCGGIRLRVTNRESFEPISAAIMLALALHEHAPEWELDHMDRMLQSKAAMDGIRAGKSIDDIAASWAQPLAAFRARRERFLLYP